MVLQCDDAHPVRLQSVQNSIFSIVANVEAAAGAAEGGDSSRRVAPSGLPELAARVAQNLQNCLGHEIDNVTPVQGRNISVFGYRYAKIGVLAGRAAISLINAVLDSSGGNAGSDAEANLQGRFDKFRELAAPLDCGAIVNRVVTESIARDIPWFRIFPEQLTIQLGQGRKLQRFRETFTRNTSFIATKIATNKNAASRLFP